jgi:hypothetical protein
MKPTFNSAVRWMVAFASVSCSFLLLAASFNLPTHGGDGGHNFALDCGDDSVLVGMSGGKGDWLDSLQARCTNVSQGTWTGAVFATETAGGTGGRSSFSVTCPRNTAVKGISGGFGWYVNSLRLRCEPLGATAPASTVNASGTGSGDHSFALELCPNGKPARGFRGKAGDYIDRAGLICHSGTTSSTATSSTDPCQSVIDEIAALRRELQAKKNALEDRGSRHTRPPSEVRKLERDYRQRIARKQDDYDSCLVRHGLLPDVAATLDGIGTVTTVRSGPQDSEVHIALTFLKYDHAKVEITEFPPIVSTPFDLPTPPGGTNTTTVSLKEVFSTNVNRSTGEMSVMLTLLFHHSRSGDGDLFDSTLPLTLSTGNTDPAGSPINQTSRQVTLAGSGTFVGGILGNTPGTVVITGTLSVLP